MLFQKAIERGGISGMELVAMSMKAQGMLSCKTLSYHGVHFDVRSAGLDEKSLQHYNAAAIFWQKMWQSYAMYLDRREKDRNWGNPEEPEGGRKRGKSRRGCRKILNSCAYSVATLCNGAF